QSMDLIAEATGVGVWTTDVETRETVWNRQMRRIYGVAEDMPTRQARKLAVSYTDPEDLVRLDAAYATLAAGDSVPDDIEFRVHWPDGTVRWLATRGTVLRDEQGKALRILGFNWDITEQKHGEDIRRQKAAAEEASRAKSEFLSRMSHELRTPLNAVLGFAQLMLDDPAQTLAEKQRERTQRIHEAGRHLLALI